MGVISVEQKTRIMCVAHREMVVDTWDEVVDVIKYYEGDDSYKEWVPINTSTVTEYD